MDAKTLLVRNTENRHHTIPPPHTHGRLAGPGAPRLSVIVLDKGINVVDAAAWAEAEKNPTVKRMLDDGTIEVITNKKGQPVADLPELKPAEAVKIVKETESVQQLEEWRNEAPAPVRMAIDDQVKALKTPGKRKG